MLKNCLFFYNYTYIVKSFIFTHSLQNVQLHTLQKRKCHFINIYIYFVIERQTHTHTHMNYYYYVTLHNMMWRRCRRRRWIGFVIDSRGMRAHSLRKENTFYDQVNKCII